MGIPNNKYIIVNITKDAIEHYTLEVIAEDLKKFILSLPVSHSLVPCIPLYVNRYIKTFKTLKKWYVWIMWDIFILKIF